MIQDTYILQKDLPDGSKAGDCYKQSSNRYYNVRLKQLAVGYDESLLLEIYQVENNPEWFKKEEELLYKVDDLVGLLRDCVSSTWGNLSLTYTQQLFDRFLEQRKLVNPNLNKTITRLVNEILLDKEYTQQDMRDCFFAAKLFFGKPIGRTETYDGDWYETFEYKYKKFEDYLKTIQNKNS